MELSLELFDEITGLGAGQVPPAGGEGDRREHRRFAFGSRAVIEPSRPGAEWASTPVLLRDISLAGIGFLHSEALKAGEPFVIHFSGRNGRTIKIACQANRAETGGSGGTQYVIGASFQKLLEIVEPVVQKAPDPPPMLQLSRPSRLFGRKPAPAPAAPAPAASAQAAETVNPVAAPAQAVPVQAQLVPATQEPAPQAPPPTAPQPSAVPVEAPPQPQESHQPPPTPAAEPAMHVAPAQPETFELRLANHVLDEPPLPTTTTGSGAIDASLVNAKHRQIIEGVKTRLLRQNQDIQTQLHQLKTAHQEINSQKEIIDHLSRQRDQFQAELDRQAAELTELRQVLAQLQAKAEADDHLMEELAAVMEQDQNPATKIVAA